jgi:hypothetical protein
MALANGLAQAGRAKKIQDKQPGENPALPEADGSPSDDQIL